MIKIMTNVINMLLMRKLLVQIIYTWYINFHK